MYCDYAALYKLVYTTYITSIQYEDRIVKSNTIVINRRVGASLDGLRNTGIFSFTAPFALKKEHRKKQLSLPT
jgi:hypothetical protein